MPNHITTEVEIKGSEEAIKKLIKDTKIKLDGDIAEGDNEFDFNGIVKMPPSMSITSGSSTDLGMAALSQKYFNQYSGYPWFPERYPNVTTPEELKAFLETSSRDEDKKALEEGQTAISNLEKYGYKDWYDWCNANWGTKWNAYDVHYTDHKFDGDNSKLVIQINTAWDTPREIWSALEAKGYTVRGVMYGEMDGYDFIGDGDQVFDAYQDVTVEYIG